MQCSHRSYLHLPHCGKSNSSHVEATAEDVLCAAACRIEVHEACTVPSGHKYNLRATADIPTYVSSYLCIHGINKAKPPDDTLKIRNVNKDTLKNFTHKVTSTDWNLICKDVHDANTIYNIFFQTFESTYNDCFPLITITQNRKILKTMDE